jgi:RND family efflux transporter MFP subunit
VLCTAILLTAATGLLWAHAGHAPLPTSGIQVDLEKGQVILTAEARHALDVQTAEVGTDPPPATALAYARLVAPWQKHAFAASRLGGRISTLHVRPGESVRAGAILAEIQSPELDQLRLAVATARTEVRQAEQVLAGLKGSAVVTGQQVLDAENQLRQSQIAQDVATTKWRALGLPEEQLEQAATTTPTLPIQAPVGGTVIHADLAIGKVVEPGEHLFEIVDHSTVWARIGVLEVDLPRVTAGRAVELHLTAYPGQPLRGKVEGVEAALDPATLLTTAWAEFPNPVGAEPRLLPGMSGQARIELPVPKGTKTVPADALVSNGVDHFVLVETASTAERSEYQKKSVTVVREAGGVVVIRSADVFAGDRVVTRGSHELGGLFEPEHVLLTPETQATIGLVVDRVGTASVDEIVSLPGTVELPPDRRTVAAAPLAGTLVSIRVERGQRVAAGDVLGEVFSLEFLTLQLDYLREALAADLANEQLRQLRGAEGVARRRLIDAEAAATASVARRDSLRRRLGVLGLASDQLDTLVAKRQVIQAIPVRANLAGTLVGFGKVLGQSVRADEALFEVHDASRAWVRGAVSERDVSQVKIGQSARVRLASDSGRTLTGKVVRSGRTFDPADRALSVWVELDGPAEPILRHGQMTRITLSVGAYPPTLAVPLGAVVRDGTRAYVFVQQPNGTFDRRAVRLGRSDDRNVEVLSGLTAGESIAVSGAAELATAYASVH